MRRTSILALALLLAGGCALTGPARGRQLEARGEYYQAYEVYRTAVETSPGDDGAAAGLKRTAPLAAAYWQKQAFLAAESGQWERAANCHVKVLRIKPDEVASVMSLRQIARQHPDAVELAAESSTPVSGVSPTAVSAVESAGETPVLRETPATRPAPPKPPTPKPLPKPAPPPEVVRAEPIKPPAPKPPAHLDVPQREPTPPRVDPFRQKPRAHYERLASFSEFVVILRVSRDDRRYSDKAWLRDGILVKLKDTDNDDGGDADIEIHLENKKLAKLDNLRTDAVIPVMGVSGREYEIVIMGVHDKTETVTLGLRTAPP